MTVIKKEPRQLRKFLNYLGLKKRGIVLLSHEVSLAVSSPKSGLTSVFGMGTGASRSL